MSLVLHKRGFCLSHIDKGDFVHIGKHLTGPLAFQVCQSLTQYIIDTYDSQNTAVAGRALGSICDACCGDELCNKYACSTVKRK